MKTLLFSIFLMSFCKFYSQNNGMNFMELNNNYIITPNNSAINVTNNFTIEFWIRPSKTETWALLLQEGKCSNASTSYNVSIQSDSTIAFAFNCSGSCTYTKSYKCSTKIYPGSCVHVAITYSPAGVSIYYNGLLQPGQYTTGTYCGTLYSSSEPLRIGVYKYYDESLGAWYDGMMDELRIWGIVLTPSEIFANYQDTLIGNESGLRLYYKFDTPLSGTGMTITNYATTTGSALNGTTYSLNSTSPYTGYSCFVYTGVPCISSTNDISVYPNPTFCKITVSGKSINKIEINNFLGENIYTILSQQNSNEIDLSNFPKGIYFVKIYEGDKFHIEKIVTQ
ncbi:MAG: LamG-like jellyroll fold domain-containing protein [Bacteroidota bacterium]